MSSADYDHTLRQSGRTSAQMDAAPIGSIFIWVNDRLDYPKNLARWRGRDDLKMCSPTSFAELALKYRGAQLGGLVLGHAASLTAEQKDRFLELQTRVSK